MHAIHFHANMAGPSAQTDMHKRIQRQRSEARKDRLTHMQSMWLGRPPRPHVSGDVSSSTAARPRERVLSFPATAQPTTLHENGEPHISKDRHPERAMKERDGKRPSTTMSSTATKATASIAESTAEKATRRSSSVHNQLRGGTMGRGQDNHREQHVHNDKQPLRHEMAATPLGH